MTGQGVAARLTNIEPIEGADRIVQARVLGETVIVSKDHKEGELGILFDSESALDLEYRRINNLNRHEHLNADITKKGLFEDNGRVRPIKLKGVRVSGFWIPVSSLEYTGNVSDLKEGYKFNEINGHKIVEKYVPKFREKGNNNQQKAIKVNYVPTFKEHFSTDHLLKSLGEVKDGNFVMTVKLHGTSLRCANLQARKPSYLEILDNKAKNPNKGILRRLLKYDIFRKAVNTLMPPRKEFEYRNVIGSRTVVKSVEGLFENPNAGYYDTDIWTKAATETFGDNLLKGECIYAEVVGYNGEKPLMPSNQTKSLEKFMDKEQYKATVDQFGDTIHYNYGVRPGEYDVYVYRITMTNEDGEAIDLSWDQVKLRCEKLGVKPVPEIGRGSLTRKNGFYMDFTSEDRSLSWGIVDMRNLQEKIDELSDNAHYKGTFTEGICFRQEGYPNCKILKHKSYFFKVLSGFIKDSGIADVEEQN